MSTIQEQGSSDVKEPLKPLGKASFQKPGDLKRPGVVVVGLCLVLLAVIGGIYIYMTQKHPMEGPKELPSSVVAEIQGFKPYFLTKNLATGFMLVSNSVAYQNNVLLFEMRDQSGKTLAFTEEAIPSGFDTSSLKADKQYNNQFGQAYVSDLLDRTTGALFTNDNTWILVNAPTPIGSADMQQIIDGLTPQ